MEIVTVTTYGVITTIKWLKTWTALREVPDTALMLHIIVTYYY